MRLLICAGGTGGGVYPALSVYEALKNRKANMQTLWVGGEGGMEEALVNRAGISYRSIPAAGVHGVGLRTLPQNMFKLMRGVLASKKILNEFKPDVLFFTGGYVAAPMAFAGRNIPIVLYVPDIEPGLALKFLANFADVITLTADDSKKYFSPSKKLVVTGYPLRSGLSTWSRTSALSYLKLDSTKPVLLVTGGSKGARSINTAVVKHLKQILEIAQVIHITGETDYEVIEKTVQDSLSKELTKHYHIMPYLHDMGAALASADLVLSRAGASSLGEYPYFELPAILVPYPYAWRYQKVNADYLANQNAAVILQDELLQDQLFFIIKDILLKENKRQTMKAAMKKLSTPNAADLIASQLVELAGEQPL
ncbi:MAG: undecaprenyldiphospho-muramoylpentapeptide beta-N-acetylglucosaminyltransferase [Anaerolineales bacterium]|nr:undecaprenyldiphospho-muramoylpentapeptide beta-N-acetylglucosaminyltransferase [Anaerolineales bacterium]